MKTYYQILKEAMPKTYKPTEDEILDFEEDLPEPKFKQGWDKNLISKGLSLIKTFPDQGWTEDDVRDWVIKGGLPEEVINFVDDMKYKDDMKKWADKADREERKREKANRPPKPKMSKGYWRSYMMGVASDTVTDLQDEVPNFDFSHYAADIADSLLIDPEVSEYVNYHFWDNTGRLPKKWEAKEWLADELYSYAP